MADLDDLLTKTSRTFALSIPLLPEPTRLEVTLGYLLFRIADTFEDAKDWAIDRKVEALHRFCELLELGCDPTAKAGAGGDRAFRRILEEAAAGWADAAPIDHDGYQELLREVPDVLEAFFALDEPARGLIREHVTRTSVGMADYVARTRDGELALRDLEDLQHYCYIVAGIVGEMLTELFLLGRPELSAVADGLRRRARRCGEAQQLVNILKDSAFDADEGRSYLAGSERTKVFALARADLETAGEYILLLQESGTERGLVAFNALPVLLAKEALDVVETDGPGAKVERPRVFSIMETLERNLDAGRPVVSLNGAAATDAR
ncbi:MAG: squalene/phytoene synthase family protein [Acidobacteriota bacterium]